MIKIIIGLGNPGIKYKNNVHNIGFKFIDFLLHKYEYEEIGTKFNGQLFKVKINNQQLILAKPQTYMNLSGQFVQKFCAYFKIKLDEILIVYDDISINTGLYKIRIKGSSGGHNGIKNIISMCGSENIKRLKIGVGPVSKNYSIINYVLSDIEKNKMNIISKLFADICDLIDNKKMNLLEI